MQDDKDNQVIEVPDFKSPREFRVWARNLNEKEIQSWRAKDWNRMYEKLLIAVDSDPEIESEIPNALKNGKMTYKDGSLLTVDQLPEDERLKLKCLIFMDNPNSIGIMGKLYANYRMEPEQIKKIYELAQKAGKEAREKKLNLARASASPQAYMYHLSSEVVSTVYSQSTYSRRLDHIQVVEKNENIPGHIRDADKNPEIIISTIDAYDDVPLEAMFHEAAHAYLQLKKTGEFAQLKPVEKFDDDFVKFLTYNYKFYLDFDKYRDVIKTNGKDLMRRWIWGNISDKTAKKYLSTGHIYRQQPIEYFAHLYSFMAERSFRNASGQYTERGISLALKYLSKINKELGEPSEVANDEKGNIIFKFNKSCWSELKNLFTGNDNPLDGQIEIENNKYDTTVRMQQIFFAENKWKEWEEKIWQPFEAKRSKILRCIKQIIDDIEAKDILPDKNGNIVIHDEPIFGKVSLNGNRQQYFKYLFKGKNNPLKGKIKIINIDKDKTQFIISNDKDILGALNKWQKEILDPMQEKVKEFAKAFTSKIGISRIDIMDGVAKIEFDKKLPYTDNEIIKKIYGFDLERLNLRDKIKIISQQIFNGIKMDANGENVITPPVYSKEFDRLLSLFKKDKIGWIEAEQKRDAIKRYRRIKFKRIARRMGLGAHND